MERQELVSLHNPRARLKFPALAERRLVPIHDGVLRGRIQLGRQHKPEFPACRALERDPGLVDRVAIYAVMGGVFAPLRFLGRELPVAADHNLDVDPDGAVLALNAGLPTLYVPCDVTFGAFLERRHLDSLRGGDELCRVLADHVDVWTKVVARGRGAMPEQYVALLHDPLTVACLVDRRFVTSERRPVTVGRVGPLARTFVDPVAGREAEVVTSVDAPAFADFWLETVLG